ncbi:MAG: cation:proton antiporter, partial [Gammaproteobacteria bacterium]|nr:cation:proton antiporter [Gammaproteobacteria bacterium]
MPLADTILLMMALLAIAMVALALARNLPIPYTVFLVLIGMLLHYGAVRVDALAPLADVGLTPDLVFFVFLPALIFESALNLDARQLLKDIAPILALSVPALLISIAIIGVGISMLLGTPLPLALTFGALIAATDPVAVIALFKELGAPNRLTVLVEGESLFNDATAIVVFHILLGIALAGEFSAGELPHAIADFLRVFFGGVLVGAVVGFGISEIMRRIKSSSLALVVMTLVMAYASFVLAEHTLHVSGVMAALSAAIAMGLYAVTRIPQTATRLIHETWEVIALIANSLLFLMIGLTVDLGNLIASGGAILLAAVLVVLARAAAIYSLVPVATRAFRLPTVSMGERHIMWWGGLKGGLAIAIVLSIPEELAGRDFLVTLTLGVVMFTLLVNAPTIRPLIARLGIDRLTMDEQIESNRAFVDAGRHSAEALQRFRAAGLLETGRVEALQQAVQLAIADGDSEPPPPQLRSTYLEAFRIERSELDVLFEIAMIHEYTYLDMLASLRRRRDSWGELHGDTGPESSAAPNPFERIERAMLHWTREQNLLAGLLARYQRLRFGQRLQRDIAGIMTSVRVIGLLPSRPGLDPEHVDTV